MQITIFLISFSLYPVLMAIKTTQQRNVWTLCQCFYYCNTLYAYCFFVVFFYSKQYILNRFKVKPGQCNTYAKFYLYCINIFRVKGLQSTHVSVKISNLYQFFFWHFFSPHNRGSQIEFSRMKNTSELCLKNAVKFIVPCSNFRCHSLKPKLSASISWENIKVSTAKLHQFHVCDADVF